VEELMVRLSEQIAIWHYTTGDKEERKERRNSMRVGNSERRRGERRKLPGQRGPGVTFLWGK
jgi:hypothetical protein